ncbi:hypothetical protein F5Y12DRAFT_401651 [Xylaria sp. FL1777]|nr:hypothetical protein F5Y12DRAFT_401651 [Xylaria sp. FL1777]
MLWRVVCVVCIYYNWRAPFGRWALAAAYPLHGFTAVWSHDLSLAATKSGTGLFHGQYKPGHKPGPPEQWPEYSSGPCPCDENQSNAPRNYSTLHVVNIYILHSVGTSSDRFKPDKSSLLGHIDMHSVNTVQLSITSLHHNHTTINSMYMEYS